MSTDLLEFIMVGLVISVKATLNCIGRAALCLVQTISGRIYAFNTLE